MKAISILLIILQAAVMKSLAYRRPSIDDCQFTYDASSLMDDSDYQVDGSGSDAYTIGGNNALDICD